ncbi:uncharacterized protein DNG_07697 [Cephalotrichum gorgonifer]|uniref:UspA domain-containing protein n=1 Tax=Cephalotrichum gorgonifer TaxID=2041049 RepID=A0AAE8SYG9_9PEZI|nr:uncharacterized protein DNG_07697 [Cephalotrichum gorgonifer]
MSGKNTMSLEAAMDEERRAILEILERQAASKTSSTTARRADSPATSPRSPIRSMLDVGETSPGRKSTSPPPAAVKYRSMLDVGMPPAPKSQPPVRSLFDEPLASPPAGPTHSAKSSLSDTSQAAASTQSARSTAELPRGPEGGSGRHSSPHRSSNPLAGYQFGDIITSQLGQSLPMPKRNQQVGRGSTGIPLSNQQAGRSSVSSPLSQAHAPAPTGPGDQQRHSMGPIMRRANTKAQSTSPHGRRSLRGVSPQPSLFSERPNQRVATLDSGYQLDLAKAYKNLSNASLLASEGPLSALAFQKVQSQKAGEGRLEKSYLGPDGEGLYTSSEDEGDHDDDESVRGRDTAPRIIHSSASDTDLAEPHSLLQAADDERKHVYKVRSLFEDEEEEKKRLAATREAVHPTSTVNSANNSENEIERDEIKKAQMMAVQLTDVFSDTEANRSVRVIYRGDFTRVAATAVEEHKKLRKYLVATDMSEHSAHAMEWAVGTVLRDGDTLVVVRCLDEESEETGIAGALVPAPAQHRSSSISVLTSGLGGGSGTSNGGDSASVSSGPEKAEGAGAGAASQDKLEAERRAAVEDITGRISRLLRRTKLQVRVIVEVIHCKNSKHLVLEMIDLVKPTLVILGSRGRSAIKGVILGSFSNYLVTKSSVPVMVARKRLKKKSRKGPIRQINNLNNPTGRSLTRARID